MPTLSGLLNDQHTLSVPYGEHTLSVTYKPSVYNASWSRTLRARSEELTAVEGLAETLAAALIAWDVQDDAGQPVPCTAEVLGSLGLGVLKALDDAITSDLLPNRRTGPSSGGGSGTTGRRG